MPKRFDCEYEPNEFMVMPCRCECGKWFDLNDGYGSDHSNKVICRDCHEEEIEEAEEEEFLDSEYEDWDDEIDAAYGEQQFSPDGGIIDPEDPDTIHYP